LPLVRQVPEADGTCRGGAGGVRAGRRPGAVEPGRDGTDAAVRLRRRRHAFSVGGSPPSGGTGSTGGGGGAAGGGAGGCARTSTGTPTGMGASPQCSRRNRSSRNDVTSRPIATIGSVMNTPPNPYSC